VFLFFHIPSGVLQRRVARLSSLTIIPASNSTAIVVATLLGLAGAALLACLRGRLIGTTLTAAWCWAFGSLAGLVSASVALVSGAALAEPLYLAAAMSTFCPLMAVLGAKRPQHRVWQWIVLSLWVVLDLPAGQWLLQGTVSELHPARSWFAAILILVGVANYLPTRYWLASLLFGAAQLVLLADFLPWPAPLGRQPNVALALVVSALAAAVLRRRSRATAEPLDRAWLDFRDLFGTVWALRVAERINSVSATSGWQVTLNWDGFSSAASAQLGNGTAADFVPCLPAEVRGPLGDILRSVLLRFVSPEWIAQRLERPLDQASVK
jgi:hypothetical protein